MSAAAWGGAPKFPPHCTLEFLMARGEPEMALATLRAMASGGIYDQVGGGFARYAVDATWTCPTSRRCSTTTRCSPGRTCTAGRSAARR